MSDPVDTETSPVNHFGVLVEYLSEYPDAQRHDLADLYGAPGPSPDQLARTWCREPVRFSRRVDETVGAGPAREALREVVYEHDIPLELDWMGAAAEQRLVEAGILNELVTSPFRDREVALPGALAVLLADELEDTRPSLAVLLGRAERERLDSLAREYEVAETGSRVEVCLRLMDLFASPRALEEIAGHLPDPDWMSSAVMVLELGGVCYWQEVFGFDIGGEESDGDVVPLMGEEERSQERRIARRLVDVGLLYRFEVPDSPHEMVAVPEEIWEELWSVGRGWLADWTRRAFFGMRDLGASISAEPDAPDLQTVGKWLVCEAANARLVLDDGDPAPSVLEDLSERAGDPDWDLEAYLELLFELSILRRGVDGFIALGAEYEKLLDMRREEFVLDALYEWCGGFVGAGFEERLPKALGLDESWREQALEILRARREYTPQWMSFEGVEQERTGAGCLRETAENSPELLARELQILNGYVWSAKMLWLDLVSLAEPERSYSIDSLVELEQMAASVCLFSQLGYLLEDPREYFYLPVQRASFLTDPFHTSEFERWLEEVVRGFLEPLGVAAIAADDRIYLATDQIRIESPPGWSEADRERLLGEILGREEFEFTAGATGRRPVEAVEGTGPGIGEEPTEVSLDRPVEEVLRVARGRPIERFDGDRLFFSSAESGGSDGE